VGFAVCTSCFCATTPLFLKKYSVTLFNLLFIILSVYLLIFSFFMLDAELHWLYFCSFIIILLGLFVYTASQPATNVKETELTFRVEDDVKVNLQVN